MELYGVLLLFATCEGDGMNWVVADGMEKTSDGTEEEEMGLLKHACMSVCEMRQ